MQRQISFNENKPTLYVVATPIGNLNEVSKRTIEVLNDVGCIYCEDTRVSANLLQCLGIHKPLFSAYENIEKQSALKIVEHLEKGESVAFMSDAGYPNISDPGNIIIKEVINNNFPIVVVNGPSALIHSVVASGLDTKHFYFYGFLNAKESTRRKELIKLKDFPDTIIFYQSPHKLEGSLQDMLDILGNRNICLCRELTKKFEEFIRGKISEVIPLVDTIKGEMVIVVEGNKEEKEIDIDDMLDKMQELISKKNIKASMAAKEISSQYGISKNELYQTYLERKEENE